METLNIIKNEYSNEISQILGFHVDCDFQPYSEIIAISPEGFDNINYTNAINDFFIGCINIINDENKSKEIESIVDLMFGNFSTKYGFIYHKIIQAYALKPPLFFRTDEPSWGKIAEIQCPGSLWGEYLAISSTLSDIYKNKFLSAITNGIYAFQNNPKIHHLLDNASRPITGAYLIQKIRKTEGIPFFGYDKLKDRECNFIRTHSFQGLVNQNIFDTRLKKSKFGDLTFDYPPTPIFDQKLSLSLPFSKCTSSYFNDNVRQYILPTYKINQDFTFDTISNKESIDEIMSLPRQKRKWYVKYGGLDTNRNWGSIDVYSLATLSIASWKNLKNRIQIDSLNNEPWIIQSSGTVHDNSIAENDNYIKISTFFANKIIAGRLAMHRKNRIVHGQSDTVLSIIA